MQSHIYHCFVQIVKFFVKGHQVILTNNKKIVLHLKNIYTFL